MIIKEFDKISDVIDVKIKINEDTYKENSLFYEEARVKFVVNMKLIDGDESLINENAEAVFDINFFKLKRQPIMNIDDVLLGLCYHLEENHWYNYYEFNEDKDINFTLSGNQLVCTLEVLDFEIIDNGIKELIDFGTYIADESCDEDSIKHYIEKLNLIESIKEPLKLSTAELEEISNMRRYLDEAMFELASITRGIDKDMFIISHYKHVYIYSSFYPSWDDTIQDYYDFTISNPGFYICNLIGSNNGNISNKEIILSCDDIYAKEIYHTYKDEFEKISLEVRSKCKQDVVISRAYGDIDYDLIIDGIWIDKLEVISPMSRINYNLEIKVYKDNQEIESVSDSYYYDGGTMQDVDDVCNFESFVDDIGFRMHVLARTWSIFTDIPYPKSELKFKIEVSKIEINKNPNLNIVDEWEEIAKTSIDKDEIDMITEDIDTIRYNYDEVIEEEHQQKLYLSNNDLMTLDKIEELVEDNINHLNQLLDTYNKDDYEEYEARLFARYSNYYAISHLTHEDINRHSAYSVSCKAVTKEGKTLAGANSIPGYFLINPNIPSIVHKIFPYINDLKEVELIIGDKID